MYVVTYMLSALSKCCWALSLRTWPHMSLANCWIERSKVWGSLWRVVVCRFCKVGGGQSSNYFSIDY